MRMLRKKRVRIQQVDMLSGPTPSLDGVLVGKPWRNAGHYVLRNVTLVDAPDHSVPMQAEEVWVPRERVTFLEVYK